MTREQALYDGMIETAIRYGWEQVSKSYSDTAIELVENRMVSEVHYQCECGQTYSKVDNDKCYWCGEKVRTRPKVWNVISPPWGFPK